MNRSWLPLAPALLALAAALPCPAQEQVDRGEMAKLLRRNQEELRDYTWESRQVYEVNGVQRRVDVYSYRYNEYDMQEKMQLSSTVTKEPLRWPNGKKLKKEEREAAVEFAREARSRLFGYLSPMFAEKAVLGAEVETVDGAIHLRSRDVMTTGDNVEIVLDAATRRPRTASVAGTLEGSPVTLELRFAYEEYGPSFAVHSVTRSSWQGLELVITTDDSKHTKD
jgi:hypothetical protein